MRPGLAVVLAVASLACGGEDSLEEVAADCPLAPALRLGELPSASVGLNAYYLQEEAARALHRGLSESPEVEETLAKAAALGARVVRTNGFNDGPQKRGDSAMQVGVLEYDETALRGLDLVLTRAAAHGVRLVLPLGNHWDAYGGARQYVAWAGLPEPRQGDARFYTHRAVIEHYKAHVGRLLDRVNAFDGRRYGEHPAVLAWELLNEPRGDGLDADGLAMRAWVDEVGAVVRAHAPGHLVGTGEEGFDSAEAGTRFGFNTASPVIDFGGAHFYPEDWGVPGDAFARAEAGARWFSGRAEVARGLGKPLFIGEFGLRNDGGLSLEERRSLYRGWLRCAWRSGVGASAPWMFAYDARPDEWDAYTFYWRDGTRPEDSVNRYADLVVEAAARSGQR